MTNKQRSENDNDAHHSRGALDDLPGLALLVDLAETSPLAELHVRVHLDQWDPVLLRNRTAIHFRSI